LFSSSAGKVEKGEPPPQILAEIGGEIREPGRPFVPGRKTVHTLGEFVPPKTAKKPPNFVAQIGGASEITDRAGPLRIYCSEY